MNCMLIVAFCDYTHDRSDLWIFGYLDGEREIKRAPEETLSGTTEKKHDFPEHFVQ